MRRIACILNLALPDNQDAPSQVAQAHVIDLVPIDVVVKLLIPILRPRSRTLRRRTSRMLMPETSMDQDYFLVTAQHDIGFAW